MQFRFEKWHGTGNDFVLVDDRQATFPVEDIAVVQRICDRHFGIGSDGLILLQQALAPDSDFHMEFFNPDGSKSFCGNGSRCAYAFWSSLNGRVKSARFTAIDGVHHGAWRGDEVEVTLPDVDRPEKASEELNVDFIHTGSPHLLVWVDDVEAVDLDTDAPPRRHTTHFGTGGTNVNYVQAYGPGLRMRTFERGVEAETLSCGSGVVAAALSAIGRRSAKAPVAVHTRGGNLSVEAKQAEDHRFEAVCLVGPATFVYRGSMEC